MYARSTTIQADPQRMDEGIAYIRDEVMPAVQSMPGCMGLSMLCDRDSGRCIVTTSWDSEESMSASRDAVRAMRERSVDVMGGQFDVQEWEIAVLHRAHRAPAGACARILWARGNPDDVERVVDTFRMAMLPRLEDLPGFCSVSLMVDRGTGRSALTVCYDSREHMQRSDDRARAMRDDFSSAMGVRITDMAEFDLVLHHLRVPETV